MTRPPPGRHYLNSHVLTFERAAAVCRAYEEQAGMLSTEFYDLYCRGEFDGPNGHAATHWASYWEAYLELRPKAETDVIIATPPQPVGDLVPA